MLVRNESAFLSVLALMDTPREDAKMVISRLKEIGIKRVSMSKGDNQQVADSVAKAIGITDALGSLLPEGKVSASEEIKKKESKVAMVGDGVHDAPAIKKSTVGIAMGAAGSDVALETADIALLSDDLTIFPFAIALSRKSKKL